jgi:hypothetical protein
MWCRSPCGVLDRKRLQACLPLLVQDGTLEEGCDLGEHAAEAPVIVGQDLDGSFTWQIRLRLEGREEGVFLFRMMEVASKLPEELEEARSVLDQASALDAKVHVGAKRADHLFDQVVLCPQIVDELHNFARTLSILSCSVCCRSVRVPTRMFVLTRGAPISCSSSWHFLMAANTWSHSPSTLVP